MTELVGDPNHYGLKEDRNRRWLLPEMNNAVIVVESNVRRLPDLTSNSDSEEPLRLRRTKKFR